jgi:hypothetical protein
MNNFYVYAYIRSKDSKTAKAGTPYYIGKGTENRRFRKHVNISIPNKNFILIIENDLTEIGALAIERRLIKWWGRKNTGTGILLNRTDGGEGISGYKHTENAKNRIGQASIGRNKGPKILSNETKRKISTSLKGKKKPPRTKEHALKISEALKGKICNDLEIEQLNKMVEKIKVPVQIFGKQYSSITEASLALNIHHETIRYRLKSKNYPEYIQEKKNA